MAPTSPARPTRRSSASTPSRTTGSTPPATRPPGALESAGLTHEIVTYPDAGHAFFNDTGPRYSPTAAAAAYTKLLDWFGSHLS